MMNQRKRLSAVLLTVFCMTLAVLAGASTVMAKQKQAGNPAPNSSPGTPPQNPAGPRAQLDETTFDFGEVMEGSSVSHDFKVKNTGTEELQITQVRPG
jgi:hypothetical protein